MPSRRRPTALLALALLALVGAGCEAFTAPDAQPSGATRFAPPARYAAWWQATRQCSGLAGTMDGIEWYSVPGTQFVDADGGTATGSYHSRGADVDRIYVASGHRLDGELVRHEMLHALMARNYVPAGHDRRYYLERCGGVVSCGPACQQSTGSYAQPTGASLTIPPGALEVTMTLTRRETRVDVDSGWVSVTVAARNPHPYPVWVSVPTSGSFTSRGFSYAVQGFIQGAVIHPGPRVAFGPRETRRHTFDVSARLLSAGPREVNGGHLGVLARPDTITIVH